jgi:predicted nucleotidyltransferase component of viral defense system
LPKLPDRAVVADLCRETAARENIQPELVEKDLYLTRVLWALGERLGDELLLKGGALLSKVDLGFLRMSDDADLVVPGTVDRTRSANVRRVNRVRDALLSSASEIGVRIAAPGGDLSQRAAHAVWRLDYDSDFRESSLVLELSIRPVLRSPRQVSLRQLVDDPLAGNYDDAACWALAADEARAEKVRSAFTRDAIRDYYDLDRLLSAGADFTSETFVRLVDAKLAELNQPPLADQPPAFGLTRERRRNLEGARRELEGALRLGAPAFDLKDMLKKFDAMWGK